MGIMVSQYHNYRYSSKIILERIGNELKLLLNMLSRRIPCKVIQKIARIIDKIDMLFGIEI